MSEYVKIRKTGLHKRPDRDMRTVKRKHKNKQSLCQTHKYLAWVKARGWYA